MHQNDYASNNANQHTSIYHEMETNMCAYVFQIPIGWNRLKLASISQNMSIVAN